MTPAIVIFILSAALLFFFVQHACQRILARQFDRDYFQSVVNANRLEFTSVEASIETFDAVLDYPWVRVTLKCDFLALSYLLKHAANPTKRYTRDDRLLMFYFNVILFTLAIRHLIGFGQKKTILQLTKVLKFLANVIGRRVSTAHIDDLMATIAY